MSDQPGGNDDPSVEEVTEPNRGGPPQVSDNDPIAPETHVAGGAYAQADYSAAARRSTFRTEHEFDEGARTEPDIRSTFEEAEGRKGPAGPGAP